MTLYISPGEVFEALRKKHGSHAAAARALSINVSYYRDIRNGRAKLTDRMRELLLLKAQSPFLPAADAGESAPVQPARESS